MSETLSIVVPVFNEEKSVYETIARICRLQEQLPSRVSLEVIAVNDGSSDESAAILDRLVREFPILFRVNHHSHNQGKGAALRTGIALATGTIIGIQDADSEYDTNDIPRLIDPILSGRAKVVYGTRFSQKRDKSTPNFGTRLWLHGHVNGFLTSLSNFVNGQRLTDMETCHKFFRAEIIKPIILTSPRFGFEPEITAKVARQGVTIMEIPVSYIHRMYHEGKKITWRDGIAACWHIVYFGWIERLFIPSSSAALQSAPIPADSIEPIQAES